jgi:RNA polymerase sigma factor (sigma-70 family)
VHSKSSPRQSTDVELLRCYIEEHDQEAFARLVNRYIDLVFTSARRQVRDTHVAEDITQQVFIKLSAKARLLWAKESLQGWLLTATRYAVLDAIKGRNRRWRREQEAARSRSPSTKPDTDLLAAEHRHQDEQGDYFEQLDAILGRALSQLSSINREVVVARFFQNKSYREIAQRFDLCEDAARQRVSRSLRRLRTILASSGLDVAAEGVDVALLSRGIIPAPPHLARNVATKALPRPTRRQKRAK